MEKILSDYICPRSFETLEITQYFYNSCCSDWTTKKFYRCEYGINEIWNSEDYNDFRMSILDGSYRYCQECPFVQMLNLSEHDDEQILTLKSNLPESLSERIDAFESGIAINPKEVLISVDITCNYKCPTCRTDLIVGNSDENKKVINTINEFEETFSNDVETITTSGTCDPFASPPIRNFLKNFNPSKYKKLKNIQINTNGSLFTKEMWELMPNIHPYVHGCSISIDAGTKHTYENIVRINGNWDRLIENLKFMSSVETIQDIRIYYVVQKCNYKEMETLVIIMKEIFGSRVKVSFTNMTNWGTFSNEEFSDRNISDETHPEFEEFKIEIDKILKYEEVDLFYSLHSKIFK